MYKIMHKRIFSGTLKHDKGKKESPILVVVQVTDRRQDSALHLKNIHKCLGNGKREWNNPIIVVVIFLKLLYNVKVNEFEISGGSIDYE